MTFTSVDWVFVFGKRSHRCSTWKWYSNEDKSSRSSETCPMITISTGQVSGRRAGNADVGNNSHHQFFSLQREKIVHQFRLSFVYLVSFTACLSVLTKKAGDVWKLFWKYSLKCSIIRVGSSLGEVTVKRRNNHQWSLSPIESLILAQRSAGIHPKYFVIIGLLEWDFNWNPPRSHTNSHHSTSWAYLDFSWVFRA